ncbi:MAG: Mbeg1-like protein [Anaerovoracaceae bacterium]
MDIISYVLGSSRTFSELPFNEVDSLVFAQLSYAKLEAVDRAAGRIWRSGARIKDYYMAEYFDKIFCDAITDDENRRLLAALSASRRFRDVVIRDITALSSSEKSMQFAAMIFDIDSNTSVAAFRGTDGSLVGWKEDFLLSFQDEIPSQIEAAAYLDRHFGRRGRRGRKLYVTGHSKGGNLAVYAACMCSGDVRSCIEAAYSMDGPGFSSRAGEVIEKVIAESGLNVIRINPELSLVGMLLRNYGECRIVRNYASGIIMQHSAYSWEVKEDCFDYIEEQDWKSQYLDRTISKWLEEATDEERERVVETLFETLDANGLKSVSDLMGMSHTDILNLIRELNKADEGTKEVITGILKSFAVSAVSSIRQ